MTKNINLTTVVGLIEAEVFAPLAFIDRAALAAAHQEEIALFLGEDRPSDHPYAAAWDGQGNLTHSDDEEAVSFARVTREDCGSRCYCCTRCAILLIDGVRVAYSQWEDPCQGHTNPETGLAYLEPHKGLLPRA